MHLSFHLLIVFFFLSLSLLFCSGFAKIVALLLVHGADPQQKNRSGDNSLHIAAANGQHEICRFLHQQAIFDVFEADAEGKTCIDKAVEGGYKELANTFTFWSCVDLRVEVSVC